MRWAATFRRVDEQEAWKRIDAVMSRAKGLDWAGSGKPESQVGRDGRIGFPVNGETYFLEPFADRDYVTGVDRDGNERYFDPDGTLLDG